MKKTKKNMKKFLVSITVFVLLVSLALAGQSTLTQKLNDARSNSERAHVIIPANAVQIAQNVFKLGTAIDKGRVIEGYAIVHTPKKKQENARAKGTCGNGICEVGENARRCSADCGGGSTGSSSCYGFLASGAKWKTTENYMVDPTNSEGLSASFLSSNIASNIQKWENTVGINIIGNEITNTVDGADTISPDGKNEIMFGSIDGDAIAVTIVWGVFSGPPRNRQLVEWDQVYDQVDFEWSSSGEPGKMDFENIATHELGHTMGLADLYTSECLEETMYGYGVEGETKKSSLESGDITGMNKLY